MNRENMVKKLIDVYERAFSLSDMRLCLEILQEIRQLEFL